MSESEAFELVMLMASELSQLMFGYFSIISAFLVMSYLVSDKLSNIQSAIILILYTTCTSFIVLNIYALNIDLDSLYAEMLLKKESGEFRLTWFGKNPLWVPTTLTTIQVAICIGGYIGSVAFFFSKRTANSNNVLGGAS